MNHKNIKKECEELWAKNKYYVLSKSHKVYLEIREYLNETKHRFLIILLNLIKCSQILILKGFEHFYCWKILHVSLYISS